MLHYLYIMTYRTVPLAEVVSNAQIDLGMTSDDERLKFRNWVYYACRTIGPSPTYIKETPLNSPIPITNFTFPAPDEMQVPIDIIISREADNEKVRPSWDPNYWQIGTLNYAQFPWRRDIQLTFQGLNFIIGPTDVAQDFVKAWVRYFAFPVDNSGEILVPELYVRAASAYVEYMHHKALFNRTKGKDSVQYYIIQDMRRQWEKLLNAARNELQTVGKPEIDAAIRNYISMLPNMRRLNDIPNNYLFVP